MEQKNTTQYYQQVLTEEEICLIGETTEKFRKGFITYSELYNYLLSKGITISPILRDTSGMIMTKEKAGDRKKRFASGNYLAKDTSGFMIIIGERECYFSNDINFVATMARNGNVEYMEILLAMYKAQFASLNSSLDNQEKMEYENKINALYESIEQYKSGDIKVKRIK